MKRDIKNLAKLYAALHGGKLAARGETVAFLAGCREGWWTQGRGANNGDCISIYVDRHWREFVAQAHRTEIE